MAKDSYTAWVDSMNAKGGIEGHPIHLIVEDDANNPATSASEVQTLVQQDHIIALVSVSDETGAWASFIQSQNIPVVGADGSALQMYTNPDFFYPGQTDDSLPASVELAAKKVGAKKLAILYCAEAPQCQELVNPEKQAATTYGVPLSYITSISAEAPSYTAQCLAAQQSGAQALFVADAVTVIENVAKDCSAQGYTPTIIASDGAVANNFNTLPGLSSKFLSMQPQIPFTVTNTPATSAMVAAFNKYQPSLRSNPNYNGEVVESWTSGQLLAFALQHGGLTPNNAPTSQQIFNGLYQTNGTTLGGLAPPLNFKQTTAGHTVDCWFWMGTSSGKWTTPYGLSPQCTSGSAG